jgi:hypothetical protein
MQRQGLGRASLAGIAAQVVFIIVLSLLPSVAVPKMDLPAMLGGLFALNSVAVGWAILFVAGIAFALLYTYDWLTREIPTIGEGI